MTENELQQAIVAGARANGWRVFFVPDWIWRLVFKAWKTGGSRRGREWSQAGFPDVVLLRRGRLIFAELKSATGRLKPEQEGWRDDLQAVQTVEWHLWRPCDLDDVLAMLRS